MPFYNSFTLLKFRDNQKQPVSLFISFLPQNLTLINHQWISSGKTVATLAKMTLLSMTVSFTCQFDTITDHPGKGVSDEEISRFGWPVGMPMRALFTWVNWSGKVPPECGWVHFMGWALAWMKERERERVEHQQVCVNSSPCLTVDGCFKFPLPWLLYSGDLSPESWAI